MDQGMSVVVYVKDVDRVSAFYQAVLGLPAERPEPAFAVLDGGGWQLVVNAIPAPYADEIEITDPPQVREETPVKAVLPVADLDLDRARAAAAGHGGRAVRPRPGVDLPRHGPLRRGRPGGQRLPAVPAGGLAGHPSGECRGVSSDWSNRAWRRRKVRNEVLARGLNEKLESLVEQAEPEPVGHHAVDFFCECSAAACTDRIRLTVACYDAIHEQRQDYIVRPGHQDREVERVVESEPGYLVVRKLDRGSR
jgi:catechol 2,3-dioxygenase-like lactoylglutathione lyase family enzyme